MIGKSYKLAGGEIELWAVPGSSVMIQLIAPSKDPIELGEGEVEEMMSILSQLLEVVRERAE